jgi:hypothetical protein
MTGADQIGQAAQAPSRRLSRLALPPMLEFADVLVTGSRSRTSPGVLWPDFDRQYHARHLWFAEPACTRPDIPEGPVDTVSEPAIFVAAADDDFGHLVASAAPRLPQSLAEGGDRPLVFSTRAPETPASLPPAFTAIVHDWFGIPPDRLRLIHRPTRFARLAIAAQGEHLGGPAPSEAYLALLGGIAARHGISPAPRDIAYVSRAGLAPYQSALAGEAYLEACLADLGVRIIRPEALPLPDQLRAYATARHLIFAEGSALHGRQLLGRIAQDISVLVRRPGTRLAQAALLARADSVEHVPATAGALHFLGQDGKPWKHSTVAFLDLPTVLDHLAGLGLPIRRIWDPARYAAARDARVLDWLRAIHAPTVPRWLRPHNPPTHFTDQLQALDLGHLAPAALDIATAGAARAPAPHAC